MMINTIINYTKYVHRGLSACGGPRWVGLGGWVALGIVKEIAEANVVQHKNRTELNITSINNYSK